jgi:NAD+ synthetase
MKKTINLERQIEELYRLSESVDEVNWNARCDPDRKFLEYYALPELIKFSEDAVKRTTYDNERVKAVVGLSGGLDSTVVGYLMAECISWSLKKRRTEEPSLVLIGFNDTNSDDSHYVQKVANDLIRTYPTLPISFVETELSDSLRFVDGKSDEIIRLSKKEKHYTGELSTRLMNLFLLEFADRTNHCAVNATNGTEIVLGEFCIGAGGDYAPIADFYKSSVYVLGEILGVPEYVLYREPINSTFGNNKVKSYFREIPDEIPPREVYNVLDPILFGLFNKKYKPSTVSRHLGHGQRFVERVYKRIKDQDHRRNGVFFPLRNRYGSLRTPIGLKALEINDIIDKYMYEVAKVDNK